MNVTNSNQTDQKKQKKSTPQLKDREKKTKEPLTPTEQRGQNKTPPQKEEPNWKDKFLRKCAEVENFKKRIEREQLTWFNMANREIITKLLPILDDLERALTNLSKAEKKFKETKQGILLIHTNLYNILLKQGLEVMETKIGDELDPQRHQALTKAPTQDANLKGKITQIVAKGYLLHNKIIRTTQVIIGT